MLRHTRACHPTQGANGWVKHEARPTVMEAEPYETPGAETAAVTTSTGHDHHAAAVSVTRAPAPLRLLSSPHDSPLTTHPTAPQYRLRPRTQHASPHPTATATLPLPNYPGKGRLTYAQALTYPTQTEAPQNCIPPHRTHSQPTAPSTSRNTPSRHSNSSTHDITAQQRKQSPMRTALQGPQGTKRCPYCQLTFPPKGVASHIKACPLLPSHLVRMKACSICHKQFKPTGIKNHEKSC